MLSTTERTDLPQIEEWIKADPWHREESRHTPEFLLTGGGLMSFCLSDEKGPLCYVRLDAEGEVMRLATQFAPESEVSKKRLVPGLLNEGVPFIIAFGREQKYKGIVFESISPTLIIFMKKLGFKWVGGADYQLTFEDPENV